VRTYGSSTIGRARFFTEGEWRRTCDHAIQSDGISMRSSLIVILRARGNGGRRAAVLVLIAECIAVGACSRAHERVSEDRQREAVERRNGSGDTKAMDSDGPSAAADGRMHPVVADRDPLAILAATRNAAQRIETARLEFHRRERLGLFKSLRPLERMTAVVRERPFSVRFDWLDADSELISCVYVENENDGKVMPHHRRGLFGGPGPVVGYPPNLAVVFQKAKLPITQFGPRRVVGALMERIDAARSWGGIRSRYLGRSRVGPAKELCDHLELIFPLDDPHPAKLVDVHVSVESRLPVMIETWLGSDGARDASRLDARYIFARIEVNPVLDDDAFRMSPVE